MGQGVGRWEPEAEGWLLAGSLEAVLQMEKSADAYVPPHLAESTAASFHGARGRSWGGVRGGEVHKILREPPLRKSLPFRL